MRIRSRLTYEARLLISLIGDVDRLNCKMNRLENTLMALRDDFNQGLADLGSAITALAARISSLPDADDITQADIDALKADASQLNTLAVNSPDVPTDVDPAGTGAAQDGNPGQEPVESNPAA